MKRLAGIHPPFIDDPRPAVRVASRVALAALSAAGGILGVVALEPVLGRPYYFPAFAAITLAAVLAGGRYGVLTTAAFGAAYAYLLLEPRGSLGVKSGHELAALVFYTLTGALVAGIGGALRAVYREVRDQHRALDRILRQREDLLRALTHDIRSPLAAIGLNAALLARTAGEADPSAARRALLIQENVAAIDSMLRDLVEVVALESGQLALAREPVDVAALVARVRASLAGALPLERVRLEVAPGALPAVPADPRRVERVLVNLISNALKYAPGPVVVGARAAGGEVIVSVRDDGPGIAAEDLPHVFEKYYRASGAAAKEGLGLGLYISRLLVEAHHGRIWAESPPGKGTTFHLALPATAVPEQAPAPRAPPAG